MEAARVVVERNWDGGEQRVRGNGGQVTMQEAAVGSSVCPPALSLHLLAQSYEVLLF